MHDKKYCLKKVEEFNKHNPIYDNMTNKTCYLAYLKIGERGWVLYEDDDWFSTTHKVHTSVIKNVEYTRGCQIIVTTQNTKLTFEIIGIC